mgnify:CR=1 FL=1
MAYDSRNVEPGGIFVCIRGSRQDGHQFIRESVRRGASVILTEAATDFKQESYTVESGERKTVRRKECVSCLDENLRGDSGYAGGLRTGNSGYQNCTCSYFPGSGLITRRKSCASLGLPGQKERLPQSG